MRESANDGSDFTNPDSDYRRVFLGEDGFLKTKDSSGTVASASASAPTIKACRVKRDAAFSISSGGTAISWDNEVRDDGGFWSVGSPTRLTIPDTAWYCVMGTVNSGAGTSDTMSVTIRLNGSTIIMWAKDYETTNSVAFGATPGGIVYLTAADYLEMLVDVGATQSLLGETTQGGLLNMSIFKIG